MITIGIDIGSTTTKIVALKENKFIHQLISPTGANPNLKAKKLFRETLKSLNINKNDINNIISTGYGRRSIDFGQSTITEISACARFFTSIDEEDKTIIDIGGQDSKVILVEKGKVKDFVMNDKCAAGTGKFLELMADILEVKLERLEELAFHSSNPIKFNSTCTVFAQTELISALASGKEKPDIIKGLHLSLAERVTSLAKQTGIKGKIYLCGGVAKNSMIKLGLEEILKKEVIVTNKPQFVVVKGATLIGLARAK